MALKVGLVGFRSIGAQHAKAYRNDELAELVGICDVIKGRADQGAEQFGCKSYYKLKDMLDDQPDIQIVDVCTGGLENGSWHYEPVMEALQAGKHVLVEKPLSNDIVEAREMVAFAAAQDLYLGCNLNHYFTEVALRAKRYVDEGDIGEQIYCLHKMGFSGGEPETYAAPQGVRVKGFPWFHAKAFLAHPFSCMRYFCGDITHVQAFCNRPGFRRRVEEVLISTLSIHVRFANDCVGYLLSQRGDAAYGLGGWWSLEVAGTKGTFCIENCIEKLTYWRAPSAPPRPEALDTGTTGGPEIMDTGITDFSETFPRRIHAFLEDVTNGVPREALRGSGRDALATLEYTWAVIESYESGGEIVRPHPLPPLKGDPTALTD
ncbi:MAG: Gfo/Idh/MocA family protein [Candidatus Zipacnadales bacterium]